MRWFLGLVLVIALVLGAAYGIGRFLLPNTLEVTRTTTIDRPRASVFAMSNDLRIAREWSPYYAMDPDAEFAFGGDGPGAGQTMRWISNVREVGSGRISIVNSSENERIESILELGDRATLNSDFQVRPSEGGTLVTWLVSAQCSEGWINVPCRYMNLILRSRIQANLDNGLARLKTLTEQLPDVNFEGYDIAPASVEPQNVIFVDVSISADNPTIEDRASAEADGVNALNNFIASTGGQVTHENTLIRVFPADNGINGRYRFSVGYPYSGPAPLRLIGVRVGQTPGGAVIRGEFVGRRSQVPTMYPRLDTYMQAHRIASREGAERWEVVRPDGAQAAGATPEDPAEHVEIFFPIN